MQNSLFNAPSAQQLLPAILGHESIAKIFVDMIHKHSLPHALCFSGPNGLGKKWLAHHLIAWDFCTSPKKSLFKPCGLCHACQKWQKPSENTSLSPQHPDLLLISNEGKNILIDQVRQIGKALRFAPLFAERRWILIDEAHLLTEQAQNALLRTLENPPEKNHFILVTHQLPLLLSTLKSRCQVFRFHPLSLVDFSVIEIFQSLTEDEKVALYSLCQGCPGQAGQFLQDGVFEWRLQLLQGLFTSLTLTNTAQRRWEFLNLAKILSKNKEALPLSYEIIQGFFRDLGCISLMGLNHLTLVHQDFWMALESDKNNSLFKKYLEKISTFADIDKVFELTSNHLRDLKYHVNTELNLNQYFIQIEEALYG